MAEEQRSLRSVYLSAEAKRQELEGLGNSNTEDYQDTLSSAIKLYEDCLRIADEVSLFSPNETLEDVSSGDLQYFLINHQLAELVQRLTGIERRKENLLAARSCYESFLKLLDAYDLLSKSDSKLLEQYHDGPDRFSVASTTDASARRETKIARFREEKDLKQRLQQLRQNPTAQTEDSTIRSLHLGSISLAVHHTFASLESISQELQILALMPSEPSNASNPADARSQSRDGDAYSDRLVSGLGGAGLGKYTGPILSAQGKPLRPFTLLDKRTQLRDGVFRPSHTLPSMSIDEYLEEERKRGGIIEGGGEASGIRPEVDEDDLDKADEETMKARAWDEYTEANPKGSGNTINRG
ncbi:TAP42-like protein [Eremomyces bilateralis CBS 781.70]|uniref:TAP42-like protein n=1 Tax=Eremomyces bilateralis CBS 781.70 TaxID=1392243 RepID=A0A6G1GG49_9PEZI|nr:TAP42-like protein [Eremomyces bilateralis CBS 781.70]KAF1817048.1 TAP42-like protein [Eremomyces bilateralis CBS 781.70]